MTKRSWMYTLCAAAALGTLAVPAHATLISSSADPALAGGTVIDFDSEPATRTNSVTIGDVTFTGAGGTDLEIGTDFNGSFNTSGVNSLYNTRASNSFTALIFDFSSPVSALGFNWGASDSEWVLRAFDSGAGLLDTVTVPPVFASNAGDFYGVAASGIASATLSLDACTADCPIDWVFIDNFTYVTADGDGRDVPAPMSLALLGIGLVGLGATRRRLAAKA